MSQVLVIDMLEGTTRIGPLAGDRTDALVEPQARFLRTLPPQSLVVFLADEHQPGDFELKRFAPHCLRGTPEAQFRPELLDAAHHAHAKIEIVRKQNFIEQHPGKFDQIINSSPSRRWIVIGCMTDCCIEANVAELVYRGCNVTVVRDLIDTWHLSADAVKQANMDPAYIHDADEINNFWFEHRFPAIWGVRVVQHAHELFPQPQTTS